MSIVAIASGKGGTGKTTVATNLAKAASLLAHNVTYLDCDVEEPNGHLFLKPEMTKSSSIGVSIPKVDDEKCTYCGLCADICQYSAIICVKDKVLTFPELCHACGGCARVCPTDAITEVDRTIGIIEEGFSGGIRFVHGKIQIGEIMSPPLIKAVRGTANNEDLCIIDAPPGTSCPVITSISDADFVLLVTEPTPFGLNDLGLAIDTVRQLGLPHAVVVNRSDPDNKIVRDFCKNKGVDIIAEIPDDRRIAEAYSQGEIIITALPEYKEIFIELFKDIKRLLSTARVK
ncbi:MAG: ATP-binding protein [Thermodesulfobacteriota bacterium]|nr:ATP-binding protein [Thermodesulfobacteriota bacterium]